MPTTLSTMNKDQHRETAAPQLKLERLVGFSDAVLAIVITLLVLGLNVPNPHQVPEKQLPEFLADSLPSMLAYVTSFILVGMYWLQHYVIFHYVVHANRTLIFLNGLFLLSVSFLPFPTGLQAVYRGDRLAVVFFGCAHIVCGLALLALWLYAARRRRLVAAKVPGRVLRSMALRIAIGPAVSVLAIAVSFYSVWAGKLLFLIIPLCYLSHRLVDSGWQQRPEEVPDPLSSPGAARQE